MGGAGFGSQACIYIQLPDATVLCLGKILYICQQEKTNLQYR